MALSDCLLDLAALLETVGRGLATAGSTTTLTDTNQLWTADWWKGGTVYFLSGANTGKTAVISTNSPTVLTFPAVSLVGVGDYYAVSRGHYTRQDMVNALNAALQELGDLTQTDQTLVTVASQETYTLPASLRGSLVSVDIAASASAPYGWRKTYAWNESGGVLRFDTGKAPATSGMPLLLTYNGPHAEVSADADPISRSVNPTRLAWTAAIYCIIQRQTILHNDQRLGEQLKQAQGQAAAKAVLFPIHNQVRTPHLASY